jgi:hypothetical protein
MALKQLKISVKPGNPNFNTPIFALTADITAETHEEYLPWFNGFLRKPIEIEKLREVLSKVYKTLA